MIVAVNVMERNYDNAQSYGREEIDRAFRKEEERSAKAEGSGPCFIRDGITITIYDMVRAVDVVERKSLATSFV